MPWQWKMSLRKHKMSIRKPVLSSYYVKVPLTCSKFFCVLKRLKMTWSKGHWSNLNLDHHKCPEIRSWGFKPITDKTVAVSTQGRRKKTAGATNMSSRISLKLSDLAWHIAAPCLRVCELDHGLHTRSGLALALAVFSLHMNWILRGGRFGSLLLFRLVSVKCDITAPKCSIFRCCPRKKDLFHPVECCVSA